MATKVVDEKGNEIEVFTQEDITAKLAEREAELKADYDKMIAQEKEHQAEKLKEFQQAKNGIVIEKDAVKTMAEEAKKMAEEAKAAIETAKTSELQTKRDYWIRSVTGGDPELTKKIEENYGLLNLPSGNDKEIMERVQKAVTMSGVGAVNVQNFGSGMSFGGAGAAMVKSNDKSQFEHNHQVWKNELGLNDLIPKSGDNK